ncbi:MAG: CHAT domain-containing protein [Taibaiella sp.]|nr:CHAT domain-containing protein [Taibaiella sp.]
MINRQVLKVCFCVFVTFCAALSCMAQNLRLDLNRIDKEGATKKTNGEYLDYLEVEITKVADSFGKASKEYIFLKGFYLDEYNRRLQPLSTLSPISLEVMKSGRKELVQLVMNVYGDTTWQYYSARSIYSNYCTSIGSQSLNDDSELTILIGSFYNSISKIASTNSLSDTDRHFYIYGSYVSIASLYRKVGLLDSAILYFEKALSYRKQHAAILYGIDNFIQILRNYARLAAQKDAILGFNILMDNEELVEQKYATNKQWHIDYLYDILDYFINNNNVNKDAIAYLKKVDALVKKTYEEQSVDYMSYILNHRLQVIKKAGYKSEVFQQLSSVNEIYNKNKKLQSSYFFLKLCAEWFDYYNSIGDKNNCLKQLVYARNYLDSIDYTTLFSSKNGSYFDRKAFPEVIYIYRQLGYYYQFRDLDSCLLYHFKVLDLEENAKKTWGDYTVHQYHEIAKLLVSTHDSDYYDNALKFCSMALSEFEYAYGRESGYYKAALYTLGEIKFKKSKGQNGLTEMAPFVYLKLYDTTFVPTFNTSHFLSYGDCLNSAGKFDSADFFYQEIYQRNQNARIFRILGYSNDLQIKALNDIYVQSNLILTQHLLRYNQKNYNHVSTDLAKWLFDKNLIYQVESYSKQAERYGRNQKKTETYENLVNSKRKYDSLLNFAESQNIEELDTAYARYDFYKNLMIQDYILDAFEKRNRLSKIDSDFSFSEVQEKLGEDECFIDVIRFLKSDPQRGFSPEPYYAITILTHSDQEKLEYFFIQHGDKFEKEVQSDDVDYNVLSSSLSPMIAKLKPFGKIYFCPDGIFNLINLNSLKDSDGNYLLKAKNISYVNSTKDIFLKPERSTSKKSIIFVGNPKFNNSQYIKSQVRGVVNNASFSNFSELPYSKIEIETVEKILLEKKWQCKKYIGLDCSEKSLQIEPLKGILHIATHGYYIPDNDSLNISSAMLSNQYLRAGLVLGSSSANADNILTSYEVMSLDLENVSLVVLSACESGKGKLLPGQGAYGLQRAFSIAGAKNVLISVRNVDDKATQILMKYFYLQIADGKEFNQALKLAQLQMIEHPIYSDPKYWSGFILIEN